MGRWDEAHAATREAMDLTNEADDGTYRVAWNFLLLEPKLVERRKGRPCGHS